MKENEEQVRNTQSNEKENKKIRKMQENEENASGPRTFHFAWCLNCFGMIASHVSTVSSWMGS